MKITYSAAASLDGFIAREDGDVSWLDELEIDPNETGLEELLRSVGGLVMGRKTYEFVFDYGVWPYGGKPTWVCTHHELQSLEGAELIFVSEIKKVIQQASDRCIEHLWLVGGGRLASSFLKQGLITDLSISEMPIRLDSGIPLFSDHRVEEIVVSERILVRKNGFREIKLKIRDEVDCP